MTSIRKLDGTVKDTIKSTEEIAKATEQVALSSQKATDNAKAQLSNVEKVSGVISDISASIEEIASTSPRGHEPRGKGLLTKAHRQPVSGRLRPTRCSP